MRPAIPVLALALSALVPAAAAGQSFGLGARLAMVRDDVQPGTEAMRFTGGHVRAKMSPRTALEIALDLRTQTNLAQTERVREYPLQGSVLLFPVRTPFAPYVLGGGGLYTERTETLGNDEVLQSEIRRRFGWHAGFGAELRLGRRAAAHADYRYTFLRFGSDPAGGTGTGTGTDAESGFSRFLPSYEGSMWTAGVTLYF